MCKRSIDEAVKNQDMHDIYYLAYHADAVDHAYPVF